MIKEYQVIKTKKDKVRQDKQAAEIKKYTEELAK